MSRKLNRDEIANALRCFRRHFYRTSKNAFAPDSRRIKQELCAEFGITKAVMYKACSRTNFWKIKGTKSRKCTHCGEIKRLNAFPKQGYGWCRKCKSNLATESNRKRKEKDKEYAASVKAYHAQYHADKYNKDVHHMTRLRVNNATRRARLRSVRVGSIDAAAIYEAKRCYWCNRTLSGNHSMDHVVPISKGGAHTGYNVVASCLSCNKKKGAKMPNEWTPSGQLEIAYV